MLGLGLGIPLHYRRRLGGSIRNFMFADISALLDASGYTYNTKCLSAALDKISSKSNDLPQIYFQYLSDFVVNLGYGFDPDCLWESFRQIFPFADTSSPQILGINEVGETLTCFEGYWSGDKPITYTYQWLRNGANIAGATLSTYTLSGLDGGAVITCLVTATNIDGSNNALSDYRIIPGIPSNWLLRNYVWDNTGVWENTAFFNTTP